MFDPRNYSAAKKFYRSLATGNKFKFSVPGSASTCGVSRLVESGNPEGIEILQDLVRPTFDPTDRYIEGASSTEAIDRAEEIAIQLGLTFDNAVYHGWFNCDHSPHPEDVIGFPTRAQLQRSPNGTLKWVTGGYLFGTGYPRADAIWKLGNEVGKSGLNLSFSVEGDILEKENNIIKKARVRNIAVTHQPFNTECTFAMFAKSMTGDPEYLEAVTNKTYITKSGSNETLVAGAVAGHEGTEGFINPNTKEISLQKSLDNSEATQVTKLSLPEAKKWFLERNPDYSVEIFEVFYNLHKR